MATEPTPPSLTSFHPSPNEKEAAQFLFTKADTDQLGLLLGEKAVPFFGHSNLPPTLLGEIWQLSDPENSGFLTPERFSVACRLIGHAQATGGEEVKQEWVGVPGPFPRFDGFPIPSHLQPSSPIPAAAPSSPGPASRIQQQSTGGGAAPAAAGNFITPEEKARYAKLFAGSGPVAGLLDGDKARDIFIKSKLPFETLGQIWNLADTQSRGSLDVADFTIGMHLIQHTMNGALPSLPSVLNPALYASATSLPLPPSSLAPPGSPTPASPANSRFAASPLRQSSIPGGVPPQYAQAPVQQQQQQQWEITPQEKKESDAYFDGIDTAHKGAIEGEAAVSFFLQSGLGMEVLARVWDLADIRQTGALNKDEFAVALKLIRDAVSGKEPPSSLPLSLVPPSLRTGGAPQQQQQQVIPGPQRDLLDLMDDDEPSPVPSSPPVQPQQRALSPQITGASRVLSPQATGTLTPSAPYALQGTIFPQATGASGTLSPQSTGFGNNFAPVSAAPAPAPIPGPTSSTFFDDNDDADTSAQLNASTVQLKSLEQEQAGVTSTSTQLASQRSDLEASLSATTAKITELQTSLSAARAAHETERATVDDLLKRDAEQKALLGRARHELISAESDLSALRVEKTEIEGGYLRDKEEVREVQKRMREVGEEVKLVKEMVERAKKEARQQKGLGAIARKQLATVEGEREKVEEELREAERVRDAGPGAEKEVEEEDSPFDHPPAIATRAPLPLSPPVVNSPAGSVRSTNPFDRLGAVAGVLSPQVTGASTSAVKSLSPQVTGTFTPSPTRPVQEKEESSSKLPENTLLAVGAGVLAAGAAVGAGVAGVFGGGDEDEEKTPAAATSKEEEEVDPFGVPKIKDESTTREVVAGKLGDNEGFDEAFGDDFAATTSTSTAANLPSGFDDAFGGDEFKPVEASTEPTASTTGFDNSFESQAVLAEEHKVEEPTKDLVEEPKEVVEPESTIAIAEPERPTPSVAALAAPEDEDSDSQNVFDTPAGATSEVEEPSSSSAREVDDDEDTSSDEEEEVEDATPVRRVRDDTDASTALGGTSTSDSGESFVHVSAGGPADDESATREATEKFPSLEESIIEEPSTLSAASPISPTSDVDTFEDATSPLDGSLISSASAGEPAAPFLAATTPTAITTDLPPTSDNTTSPISTPAVTPHRRAAPPPPASRSSVPVAVPVVEQPPASTSTTDFDSAFDDSFAAPTTTNTKDDFESAFGDDFAATATPSVAVPSTSTSTGNLATAGGAGATDDDFNFDNEFTPDFDEQSISVASPTADQSFDESAFDGFDESFQPAQSPAGATEPPPAFSFDDAFAAPAPDLASSLGAPKPVEDLNAVAEDDLPAVKQLVGMGFSKGRVIDALEDHGYDTQKALNALLK